MIFSCRFLQILIASASITSGLTFFENHRYGQTTESSMLRGYGGLQNQMMRERQQMLLKFISQPPTKPPEDFKPKGFVRPEDIVGVVPPKLKTFASKTIRKKPNEAPTTAMNDDPDTGESQNVLTYHNMWSDSQFTPERIANHKYGPTFRAYNLYEKPLGKVRVHTYRGPKKEYWVLPLNHKAEQKTYSPWGYYVRQPVGSEQHKFHSPLHLSYQYD